VRSREVAGEGGGRRRHAQLFGVVGDANRTQTLLELRDRACTRAGEQRGDPGRERRRSWMAFARHQAAGRLAGMSDALHVSGHRCDAHGVEHHRCCACRRDIKDPFRARQKDVAAVQRRTRRCLQQPTKVVDARQVIPGLGRLARSCDDELGGPLGASAFPGRFGGINK